MQLLAKDVYALVGEHFGCPAREVLFVSSNCWDALGARSFGFTVFWLNRAGLPVDRLGFRPDRVLRSLDEILL